MRFAANAALAAALAIAFPVTAFAQPADPPADNAEGNDDKAGGLPETKFTISPVLLDSDDSDAVTLGLEYSLSGELFSLDLNSDDDGEGTDRPLDEFGSVGSVVLSYESSGTIATSAARNPKNFIDAKLQLAGRYSDGDFGTVMFGGFAKYETDQSFDNGQTVLGGQLTWGKYGVLGKNSFIAFDLGYGRVDPGEDTARMEALGVTELEGYDRLDFEAYYSLNTGLQIVETIELNYRLFVETDPADAIKAAGLNRFELASVKVGLPHDFFVAYSTGKLPFDKTDDQILEFGFSYKLF